MDLLNQFLLLMKPFIKQVMICLLLTGAVKFSVAQITTVANGLTQSGNQAKFGGTLTENTDMDVGTSFYLNIKKSAANYLSILNNGNIGIGTNAPSKKLDILGNVVMLTGIHRFYLNEAATFDPTQAGIRNNAGHIVINAKEGGVIYLNRDVRGDVRIQSYNGGVDAIDVAIFRGEGKVGIGTLNTSDPGYRLFVETGIRTRKIKVDQSAWPDYVFDQKYRLPSLAEVEQFIKEHQHLPDIPSATEVEQNGLDLGENQALLLKKIEELTLYVIDLKKENESMIERQAKLEMEIRQLRK